MKFTNLSLALGLLLLSAGAASAAPATVMGDLNLRDGPGTGYPVVRVMPAGAIVDVIECGGAWCRVAWAGREGFASRDYLGRAGPIYAEVPPPVVYVDPPPVVALDWGPRWRGHWRGRNHGHHGYHHH